MRIPIDHSHLSRTVSGLPTNGSTIYVRLWSLIGSTWQFTDYTYTAVTVTIRQLGILFFVLMKSSISTASDLDGNLEFVNDYRPG